MQRSLGAETVAQIAAHVGEARPAAARVPERQDDLAFFTGLWAILPVALGGWALIVWAAIRILG